MVVKREQASILVLSMLVLSALSMVVISAWHVSSLLFDVVQQKRQFTKQFYCAEVLLNSGIVLVKNNFNTFATKHAESQMPITIDLSSVLHGTKCAYTRKFDGVVVVKKTADSNQQNTLEIQALLLQKNKVVCSLRCWLERKIKAMEANNKKGYCFVVQYFTINTTV